MRQVLMGGKVKTTSRKNLDDAKAKMWFEFKPQNPYAGFNIVDKVTSTIKSAEKALDQERIKLWPKVTTRRQKRYW